MPKVLGGPMLSSVSDLDSWFHFLAFTIILKQFSECVPF